MRKILSTCFLISMVFLMAFCMNGAGFASDEIIIRIAHVLPENHASHLALVEGFKKPIEADSNGKIKVEIYPNAQLGGDRQAIESVSFGALEMTMAGGAVLSGFDEQFAVLDLPFLFSSHEAARKALDGELGTKLNALLEPHRIYNLGWCEGGFRNVTNSKQPIHTPANIKGLKIRTMENPFHIAAFKAFGANPTPMSFGELYTALQQGIVDAEENPVSIIYSAKFFEVQEYCSLTGHIYGTVPLCINKDFFDSLSPEYQEMIRKGAEQTKSLQRKFAYDQDTQLVEDLKKTGMQVNVLTNEEKQAFRQAAEPVYESFKNKFGNELIELGLQYNN